MVTRIFFPNFCFAGGARKCWESSIPRTVDCNQATCVRTIHVGYEKNKFIMDLKSSNLKRTTFWLKQKTCLYLWLQSRAVSFYTVPAILMKLGIKPFIECLRHCNSEQQCMWVCELQCWAFGLWGSAVLLKKLLPGQFHFKK